MHDWNAKTDGFHGLGGIHELHETRRAGEFKSLADSRSQAVMKGPAVVACWLVTWVT